MAREAHLIDLLLDMTVLEASALTIWGGIERRSESSTPYCPVIRTSPTHSSSAARRSTTLSL
jgi:hypothetical protein